jgi:hypothetical protein
MAPTASPTPVPESASASSAFCSLRELTYVPTRKLQYTLRERFESKVEFIPGHPCWIWIGSRQASGYGSIMVEPGRATRAHRLSWILFRGDIPPDFEIDHLCANPPCVNPAHLEPVPQMVNWMRSNSTTRRYLTATTCGHGHELTEANTYLHPRPGRRSPARHCRACRYISKRNQNLRARSTRGSL